MEAIKTSGTSEQQEEEVRGDGGNISSVCRWIVGDVRVCLCVSSITQPTAVQRVSTKL